MTAGEIIALIGVAFTAIGGLAFAFAVVFKWGQLRAQFFGDMKQLKLRDDEQEKKIARITDYLINRGMREVREKQSGSSEGTP